MRIPAIPASRRTMLLLVGAAFLGLVALRGVHELALRLTYELQGPYTADSPLYWAVGRGILNGLVPYRDLFETKPPGIFLLSSLSLLLTGDLTLGYLVQVICLLGIPLLVGYAALRICRPLLLGDVRSSAYGTLFMLLAIVFGLLMGMYTAERSGEYQVESFGAFFGTLAITTIALKHRKWSRGASLLTGFALLCAIGLKEPFLLSALGGALILVRSPAQLRRSFIVPLALAASTGFVVATFFGMLGPYITVYLPEMLGRHIHGAGPVWLRGLPWERLVADLDAYTPSLGGSIVFLTLMVIMLRIRASKSWHSTCAAFVVVLLGIYMTILSVGIGGPFYNHHFAFAVPTYCALFLAVLEHLAHICMSSKTSVQIPVLSPLFLLTLAVLLSRSTVLQTHRNYGERIAALSRDAQLGQQTAAVIDATLDACGLDRYLFLGSNGPHPFGYTKHSPLGPIFFQYGYFLNEERTSFREAFLHTLERAPLVVLDHLELSDLADEVNAKLAEHFTRDPWPCAVAERPPHYTMLYRKPLRLAAQSN